MNKQHYPLSVVIPTLGGEGLRLTLAMINSGEQIPAEILVCVPQKEASSMHNFGYDNVRIVATPARGQVAQRAFGLKLAQQTFVMQMDDDILIEPQSVRALLSATQTLGHGSVVAPFFRHLLSGDYITSFPRGWRGCIDNLYLSAVCGAPWGTKRMGKLTSAGIGYWIDRGLIDDNPFQTEWIPGGCALCRREDLVMDNYFPFSGKAFSEDLIHSIYWRRQGARLWAIPNASCSTQVEPMPFVWRFMWADLRAHLHVVKLIKGSRIRLYAWFAFFLVKQTLLALRRTLSLCSDDARTGQIGP